MARSTHPLVLFWTIQKSTPCINLEVAEAGCVYYAKCSVPVMAFGLVWVGMIARAARDPLYGIVGNVDCFVLGTHLLYSCKKTYATILPPAKSYH